MTKRQYRQYEMLVRVRNFGDAQKAHFAEGSEGARAFEAITTAVAEIKAFGNAKLTARRVSKKEKLAAKRALASRIWAIARSARIMAKSVPGADAKFPLPTRQSDVAVLQTGHLFLTEAEPVKDDFIRYGLRPTFMEELQQAVARFEETIAGRAAGKAEAVVAQKGIRSTLRQAVDTVMSLDVLVANALGDDDDVMNAWKTDRHVELAGPSASVGAPPENGVSLPASPEDHPIPPATGEPSTSSGEPPAGTTMVDDPLRRAS